MWILSPSFQISGKNIDLVIVIRPVIISVILKVESQFACGSGAYDWTQTADRQEFDEYGVYHRSRDEYGPVTNTRYTIKCPNKHVKENFIMWGKCDENAVTWYIGGSNNECNLSFLKIQISQQALKCFSLRDSSRNEGWKYLARFSKSHSYLFPNRNDCSHIWISTESRLQYLDL